MRAFIALPLPESFKNLLYKERAKLRAPNPRLKWITPENYHITLHFLGEISRQEAEDTAAILEELSGEIESFEMKTFGPDQFPHSGQPRVIYEALSQGTEECRRLHRKISRRLEELDYSLEHRKYIPHISLCRLNRRNQLHYAPAPVSLRPLETTLDSVALYQSILHPGGAVYEILAEFPLSKLPVSCLEGELNL